MKKWVHISEAVKILGISERTVRRRVDDGELKKKKKERRVYIEVEVEGTEKEKKQQKKEKDFTERAIDMLEKTIENQSKQLENQNKQISEIKELVQNEQVITRELLNRLPLLQAPSEEQKEKKETKNKVRKLSKWWLLVLPFALLVTLGVVYYLFYIGILGV
jgi:lipopolysaccharide export LptBFGC system permease protein LptF